MGETGLYVWGSYIMGLALVVSEIALLLLRSRNIRGHLGWSGRHLRFSAAQQAGADRQHRDWVA